MIEHRHKSRVPLAKQISIYHHGNFVAVCKTKDLSPDGMAVWSGPIRYQRNTLLEVEFEFGVKDKFQRVRQQTMVVHSSSDVLGLMFTGVDTRFEALVKHLTASGSSRGQSETRSASGTVRNAAWG